MTSTANESGPYPKKSKGVTGVGIGNLAKADIPLHFSLNCKFRDTLRLGTRSDADRGCFRGHCFLHLTITQVGYIQKQVCSSIL